MRKLIVLNFITVDGVIQAPGARKDDTSGGFTYGGWRDPYLDEYLGNILDEQWRVPFDLLLGRKTFEIFASLLALSCGARTRTGHQQRYQVCCLEYA